MFSFNNPFGACPDCNGLGFTQKMDPDLIIESDKSIIHGALGKIFASMEYKGFYRQEVEALAREHGVLILSVPYKDLPKKFTKELLWGTGNRNLKYTYVSRYNGRRTQFDHPFEGLLNNMERRYRETASEFMKERFSSYMRIHPWTPCGGARLKPEILGVTVGGKNIAQLCDLSVIHAIEFLDNLELTEKEQMIAGQILKEIKARLSFLANVGLDYLTMSRSAGTLSGGESQRIRLATQIGSGLVGVLYILDEPSIGLIRRTTPNCWERCGN